MLLVPWIVSTTKRGDNSSTGIHTRSFPCEETWFHSNRISVSFCLFFESPSEALVIEICSEMLDQSTVIAIPRCEASEEINRKAYETWTLLVFKYGVFSLYAKKLLLLTGFHAALSTSSVQAACSLDPAWDRDTLIPHNPSSSFLFMTPSSTWLSPIRIAVGSLEAVSGGILPLFWQRIVLCTLVWPWIQSPGISQTIPARCSLSLTSSST